MGNTPSRQHRIDRRIAKDALQTAKKQIAVCSICGREFEQPYRESQGIHSEFDKCGKCRFEGVNRKSRVNIPYSPHPKQLLVHESPAKVKVLVAGSRFGKDRCMINEFIKQWSIMMSEVRGEEKVPKVHGWIIAPTFPMARQLWRELKKFFPTQWLAHDPYESDKVIETRGEGVIEVKSADNPENLVGVGLDIVLLTEAGKTPHLDEVWSNIEMRLMSPGCGPGGKGGLGLINGCITGDSLIFTEKGIVEIRDISNFRESKGYEPCDIKLAGFQGDPQECSMFYYNGFSETIKAVTRAGYALEGTPNHPIWVMDTDGNPIWKNIEELQEGDWVAIRRGMDYWGNDYDISGFDYSHARQRPSDHGEDVDLSKITPDLAYLMGLILGDGYVDFDQGRVIIAHSEDEHETIDFLMSHPHNLNFYHKENQHSECCSKKFTTFLEWYGFHRGKKAKEKTIPKRLLAAPKWVVANFLSGLFDADGHSRTRNGEVGYSSTSEKLINEVQCLLLNFGMISRKSYNHVMPTKKVKCESDVWSLYLPPSSSLIFYEQIGFRLTRKQNNKNKIRISTRKPAHDGIPLQSERIRRILYDCWYSRGKTGLGLFSLPTQVLVGYPRIKQFLDVCSNSSATDDLETLQKLCDENYFWDQIKTIEHKENETFDFVIPTTHAFVSNGFISHNTPTGTNFYYNLFCRGQKDNPEYDPDWESWQFASYENPYLNPKYTEKIKKHYPARIYEQEILALFSAEGNSVYPTADTCATYIGPDYPEPGMTYEIGYDPGRSLDFAVVLVRNARGETVQIYQWSKKPWTAQADEVAAISQRYNYAHVVMDKTGIGDPLVEALIQRNIDLEAVYFSNRDKEQMVNHLAMLIEQELICYPKNEVLLGELKSFEYVMLKSGKTHYAAAGTGHDDAVTAMYLAYKNYNIPEITLPFMGLLGGIPHKKIA